MQSTQNKENRDVLLYGVNTISSRPLIGYLANLFAPSRGEVGQDQLKVSTLRQTLKLLSPD